MLFLLGTRGSGIAVGLNNLETEREAHGICGTRSQCLVMGQVIGKLYRFHALSWV